MAYARANFSAPAELSDRPRGWSGKGLGTRACKTRRWRPETQSNNTKQCVWP